MEENIQIKEKQEINRAMRNIETVIDNEIEIKRTYINQKIEEEVVKRMK